MDNRISGVSLGIVGDVAPELDPERLADFAVSVGVDGIDLRMGLPLPQAVTLENVDHWKRILEEKSLAVPVLASQIGLSEKDIDLRSVEEAVFAAQHLGLGPVRLLPLTRDSKVLGEQVRHLQRGFPAVRWAVETTGAWAGATKGFEHIWDGTPIWLWDMAHTLAAGESAAETLSRLGLPVHVHIGHIDKAPLGRRVLPAAMVKEAVTELLRRGYSGALAGEWLGWSEQVRNERIAESVKTLRGFLS